jgi:MFS family permease
MLLEIVMMQKYTLILGHPIFAFAVVLSSLLISSGLGSMYSDRFKDPYQAIWLGLGGIALTMAISYLTVMFLENLIIGWPLIVRMITIIILVAECGFFMGFMMPSGIRAITQTDEGSSIPWMWSVNGVFSVLASFVAIYVSIIFGYTLVFIVGLLAYTIGTSAFSIRMILKR